MTFERKSFITLDDVIAFEITCQKCRTAVSIQVKECYYKTTWQCPQCQTSFFQGGAAQNESLLSLAKSIHDILERRKGAGFGFRIEIEVSEDRYEDRKDMEGKMKWIVGLAIWALTISSMGFAHHRNKSTNYPELHNVRKVYVFNPHEFGYLAPRHIKDGLRKSKCMELANNPMQADAILMPVMYKSWLDKFGEGLAGVCVLNNGTLLCNGGSETDSVHCDSRGCMAGAVPNGSGQSWEWILIDPKTGERMSTWDMKAFPSAKKLEQTAGCK
ncbi:MAG: hypothetical protein ACRD2B_10265 [Terriglobia bacterium]